MKTSAPTIGASQMPDDGRRVAGKGAAVTVDVPLGERDRRGPRRTKREINTK